MSAPFRPENPAGQAVAGLSLTLDYEHSRCASERSEQRAAEQEQRVHDRWTTTGKADAVRVPHGTELATDAAKPTYKRSPWWVWT